MVNRRYDDLEELKRDLEELGCEVDDREIEIWNRLKGEEGEVFWIDNDLGYDSGVFILNDEEMYGYECRNDCYKEFKLSKREILCLLSYMLDVKQMLCYQELCGIVEIEREVVNMLDRERRVKVVVELSNDVVKYGVDKFLEMYNSDEYLECIESIEIEEDIEEEVVEIINMFCNVLV